MKKSVIVMALLCLLLLAQGVFAQESYTDPQPIRGLVYNGTKQFLLTAGSVTGDDSANYYYFDRHAHRWTNELDDIPSEQYPKTYKVYWVLYRGEEDINTVENLRGVREETVTIEWLDQPQAKSGLEPIQGMEQDLVDPDHAGTFMGNDRYFYRVKPDTAWQTDIPKRQASGCYTVEYLLSEFNGMNPPDGTTTIQEGSTGSFQVSIGENNCSAPGPQPGPQPGPGPRPQPGPYVPPIRPIYDGETLFNENYSLPGTGFPTRFHKPLAVQPGDLTYDRLEMRIQIPTINVDAELTGVPVFGNSWAVDWLGERAGLLNGSAMPGDGFAMIAAHNHLDAENMGPFGLLFSLSENDRIFINTADGGLQIYTVYANELLEPDDMQKLSSIAHLEKDSIILVTCENEMVEGGYQNRRAVFAKPL